MYTHETEAHQIASMAQRAVLYEVTATPKPGLVDRNDSGAHRDMDFYTFMDSSVSLYKGFFDCAMVGLTFEGDDLSELLQLVRRPGVLVEKQMFLATKGINTHKGIVFSLGLSCAAVGYLKRKKKKPTMVRICRTVSDMTSHLIETDFSHLADKPEAAMSYGEKLYLHYGLTGIRGEVASGFGTIQREVLKPLKAWHKTQDLTLNDLMLELLLRLMQTAEDTNLITRGGLDGLVYAKRKARDFIRQGGMRQADAYEKLRIMNLEFCDRRLSPGGSADLLSVALFLAMSEGLL